MVSDLLFVVVPGAAAVVTGIGTAQLLPKVLWGLRARRRGVRAEGCTVDARLERASRSGRSWVLHTVEFRDAQGGVHRFESELPGGYGPDARPGVPVLYDPDRPARALVASRSGVPGLRTQLRDLFVHGCGFLLSATVTVIFLVALVG